MKLLLITYDQEFPNEHEVLSRLFDAGLEILHIRKPLMNAEELARWIEEVPATYHKRLVLHGHHALVRQYQLKGWHLNAQSYADARNEACKAFRQEGYSCSYSAHSFAEIEKLKDEFDYFFLSPVFDSISKVGYQAAFNPEALMSFPLLKKCFALGGISPSKLELVEKWGFAGAAVLGRVWNLSGSRKDASYPIIEFNKLFSICKQ